jgi:Zeta toxin
MMDRAPLAVLVSGAPGSGKTTLAEALGQRLDLPVLHNGELVHGTWRTLDHALELGVPGLEAFYRTLELWLDLGVSFVADHTFERGVSEPDVACRLAPRAFLVNVHCRSVHAPERFAERMRAEPLCGEQRLAKLLPRVNQLQAQLAEPLELSCHTIVVDTDDGYAPTLDAVTAEIDAKYSRPKIHDLDRPFWVE